MDWQHRYANLTRGWETYDDYDHGWNHITEKSKMARLGQKPIELFRYGDESRMVVADEQWL